MEVVIITGLSGAGKTKAADWFEDRDYYCIDNMPPALIKNFIDLAVSGGNQIEKAAFVIDIRGGQFLGGISDIVGELAADKGIDFKILYIEASDEALVRRYKENRRIHPLSMAPISKDIITKEREMLVGLRAQATYIIDTSFLKVAGFNSQLDNLFNDGHETESFLIDIQSFGFKKGVPQEADIIMDVRFIPNPYYVPSLKHLTGNNKKVAQYVMKHSVTKEFIDSMHTMLARLIPCYVKEGKYSLRIAFGCTGGQHRSVAVANEMARIFREEGRRVTLEHREL
jgi:UPF0042 nucleotide-binding protein